MENENKTMAMPAPQEETVEENFKIVSFGTLLGTNRMFVILHFVIPSLGRTVERIVPVEKVESKKFRDYVPVGFVMKNADVKDQVELIRTAIYDQLKCPQDMKTLLPQGYNYVNGHWVYVVGNLIFNKADTDNVYPYNPEYINLLDLTKMSADEKHGWPKWCMTFLGMGPEKAALWLCALSSYLRPISEQLQQMHSKSVNAFVTGPTGCGKTSVCALLSVLPDGRNACVNLGSDRAVLYRELENYDDCSVLVDGLNLSCSSSEGERKFQYLSELIQADSGAGSIVVKGAEVELGYNSLLFAGEYLPDAHSTLNRCVVIRFDGSFPAEALTVLQSNHKQYRLFLLYFISWLMRNEKTLVKDIRNRLMNGEFEYTGAHGTENQYAGFYRILSSARLLLITKYVLMEFMRSMDSFGDHRELKKIDKTLEKGITGVVADTLECVCLKQELSETLDGIRRIFLEDPDDIVAQNFKEYYNSDVPDGKLIFRYHDRVYFQGKKLILYLKSKYGCAIAVNKFSEELRKFNLLIPRGKEPTGKLPQELMAVNPEDKKCTARYYCLSIPALVDFLRTGHPNALEYSGAPLRDLFFKR